MIRTSVALSRLDHLAIVRIGDRRRFEALIPLDLHHLDGRVRPTLLLREDGTVQADLHIFGVGDGFLALADGASAAELGGEDLRETHVLLSLNGPYAWELLAKVQGPEVLGLSFHTHYAPAPGWRTLRLTRTGETGYDLIVPRGEAGAFEARLREAGRALDLADASRADLDAAALENGIFVLSREGGHPGLTPVELQLQWRLSPTKRFRGSDAVAARRATWEQRITGFAGVATDKDEVCFGGQPIGTVLAADGRFGVALLDRAYAAAGVGRYTVRGATIHTASRPFVPNLSLTVRPDRDSYRRV